MLKSPEKLPISSEQPDHDILFEKSCNQMHAQAVTSRTTEDFCAAQAAVSISPYLGSALIELGQTAPPEELFCAKSMFSLDSTPRPRMIAWEKMPQPGASP